METIEGAPPQYVWVSHGRLEGHLALNYSPAGAFSPDSSQLAIASQDKVVLFDLGKGDIAKVLHPHVGGVTGLEIESANFLAPTQLFVLASGYMEARSKEAGPPTPEMALLWDTGQDTLVGKVHTVGAGGGYKPARYFPYVRHLGLTKENFFELWNPLTGAFGRLTVPPLTRPANLFNFSPDGHWLVVAQIEGDSTGDPVVIRTSTRQIVDSLRGHAGTVLGIAFSRDSSKVVTACEDGKARVYAVPGWKLLVTLAGHQGPVHWADFSASGQWVVSAGEDKTVRVWSAEDGKLLDTLQESQAPVLSATFSPDGHFIAASTEKSVLVWTRAAAGN